MSSIIALDDSNVLLSVYMCSFSRFWLLISTCSIQSFNDFRDTIILLTPGTSPTGPWAPWASLSPVLLKILLFGTSCDSLSVLPLYPTLTHHTSTLTLNVNFPCYRAAYTKRTLADTPTLTHKLKLQHSSSLRHPGPGMSHIHLTHPASHQSFPGPQPVTQTDSLQECWTHSFSLAWKKCEETIIRITMNEEKTF